MNDDRAALTPQMKASRHVFHAGEVEDNYTEKSFLVMQKLECSHSGSHWLLNSIDLEAIRTRSGVFHSLEVQAYFLGVASPFQLQQVVAACMYA